MKLKSSKILNGDHKAQVHHQSDEEIGDDIHCIIVLGGDGTLLYLCSLFRDHQHVPPIVCFQRGSLGFLAPFQMKDYKDTLRRILDIKASPAIAIRMRLTARIWRHPDNMHLFEDDKDDVTPHFAASESNESGQSPPNREVRVSTPKMKKHRSWSKEVADHQYDANQPRMPALPSISSIPIQATISESHSKRASLPMIDPIAPSVDVVDSPDSSLVGQHEDSFIVQKDGDILFAKTQTIFPDHCCNDIIRHALNEVLIHRDNNASLMTAKLFIDGDDCTTIQADGMIFR